MGCLTYACAERDIEVHEGQIINPETQEYIKSVLMTHYANYAIFIGDNGINFCEEYRSLDDDFDSDNEDFIILPEAIILKTIIDKILILQPELIFNGEIALSYDFMDTIHKIKVENNVIYTAYSIMSFSKFEVFNS